MTQKKKLVELIEEANSNYNFELSVGKRPKPRDEYTAEHLLENGVTVQPCRAGDSVYFLFFDDERGIWDYCESEIKDVCNRGIFTSPFTDEREDDPESWQLIKFGTEDMFFTREEAEKAISGKDLMPG